MANSCESENSTIKYSEKEPTTSPQPHFCNPTTTHESLFMSGELKQWLENLGIDAVNAATYAQRLGQPDIGYTTSSMLIANPLNDNELRQVAGVNVLRHRKMIIDAVQQAARVKITQVPRQSTISLSLRLHRDVLSRLTQDPHVEDLITYEGLNNTPWAIDRSDLCNRLIEIVEKYKRLLVRGPFASGKTALVQLLHHHLSRRNKTAYAITLAGSYGSWQEWWLKETLVPWEEIISSNEPVFVIVDEAQHSYPQTSNTHNLWGCIKTAHAVPRSLQRVHFICLGAYGDPDQMVSPDTFDPAAIVSLYAHNGTPGLVYAQAEFRFFADLKMQVFAAQMSDPQHVFEIDDRSANFIFHVTGGHPGLIGYFLSSISQNIKNYKSKGVASKELYAYLHSSDLHTTLKHTTCRSIPNFKAHIQIRDACKCVLESDSFKILDSLFPENLENSKQLCVKASILVIEGDYIMFASPIVQDRALAHCFSEGQADPVDLDTFIVSVVQRFSSRQLQKTKSKDTKSRIMEGQWQDEFSRAAASLLPVDAVISPEYGRELGVKGQVDFYIAKYNWLIEILREGIALGSHERRFEPGGQYATLHTADRKWAVIDFRGTGKDVRREAQPHTYHVRFNDEFTAVDIHDPDGEVRSFALQGDQARAIHTDITPGKTPNKLKQDN